jgi:tetrahydromethanopterin S-methyltransferase subunit G
VSAAVELGPIVLMLVGAGLQLVGVVVATRDVFMAFPHSSAPPWLRWLLRLSTRGKTAQLSTGVSTTRADELTVPLSRRRQPQRNDVVGRLDELEARVDEARAVLSRQASDMHAIRQGLDNARLDVQRKLAELEERLTASQAEAFQRSTEIELRGAAWLVAGTGMVVLGAAWALIAAVMAAEGRGLNVGAVGSRLVNP